MLRSNVWGCCCKQCLKSYGKGTCCRCRKAIVEESFNSSLLEYPQYTYPRVFKGDKIPDILVGGVVGGGVTFFSFKPCCNRLQKTLRDTNLSNPKHVDTNEEQRIYNDIVNDDLEEKPDDGTESDEE